jgi:predicted glutamine amidotransferase
MCMILYCPVGIIADKNSLYDAYSRNSHGCGFMYAINGNIKIKKTLVFENFYKRYINTANILSKKTPFIIHFRTATSGKRDLENCHPFMINDNIAFAHNGVISNLSNTKDNDLHSDSYLFNEKILKGLGNHIFTNEETRVLINDYIGEWNKLVFLKSDGEVLIFNEDKGEWKNKIWFSNKTYISNMTYTPNMTYMTSYNSRECIICKTKYVKSVMVEVVDQFNFSSHVCIYCVKKGVKIESAIEDFKNYH